MIGSKGQIAQSIAKISYQYPSLDISFSDRTQLDLAETISITNYFDRNRFDVVINSAAFTAVDQAESDPDFVERINHHAVKQLAGIARKQQFILIQVSTDYVFDGTKNAPYLETDLAHPSSVYGQSKRNGEKAIEAIVPMGCIVRTGWLYSEFGQNFVKTMLQLGKERDELNVVYDQIGSPTYATDLARVLLTISTSETIRQPQESTPIFHYTNQGIASWYDFAMSIFELTQTECKVHPITSEQYSALAKRPHYSILNTKKIKGQFQITIPYWRDSLQNCLNRLNL